ncbi:MAG: hypothetical protein ACFFG0_02660 [Candidatus Thorarchaeota archaeon]
MRRQLWPRPHYKCPHCGWHNTDFISDNGDRFLRKCRRCNEYSYEPIIIYNDDANISKEHGSNKTTKVELCQ